MANAVSWFENRASFEVTATGDRIPTGFGPR